MKQNDPNFDASYIALKQTKLFRGVAREVLQMILGDCEYTEWQKGENIDSDLTDQYLFILLDGKVKITQIDPRSGRSVALFLLQTGDIYDFLPLLDGKEHLSFPVPLEPCKLLRVPLETARDWIRNYAEFNQAILPYLGDKMREMESFSISLVFHDTTTRLANLILKHTKECKDDKTHHYSVKLINNLSHESLAELIGSVRAVVSIQLKKLKEEETIVSKRGQLAVKNLEKLLHRCDIEKHSNI